MNIKITVGSGPAEEDCAQLGTEGFEIRAYAELKAYKGLIRRAIAAAGRTIPEGFKFIIRENPHDFGVYLDLAVSFPEECVESSELFTWIDEFAPPVWDEEARQELGLPEAN